MKNLKDSLVRLNRNERSLKTLKECVRFLLNDCVKIAGNQQLYVMTEEKNTLFLLIVYFFCTLIETLLKTL